MTWPIPHQVDCEGVIAGLLPPDAVSGEPRYEVAVFHRGRYSGHLLPLGAHSLRAVSQT